MIDRRSGVADAEWRADAFVWVGRMLLLVPEAPLIAALVCMYLGLGEPPVLGLIIALLVVSFMMRTAALHLARVAIEAAYFREADALLQVAFVLYPWSADGLALRGTLALATEAPVAAESALRQAIELLPGQSTFHAALSSTLLALGRPAEAAAAARQALILNEYNALAHLYLAEAEQMLGASAQSVEDRIRAGLAVAATPATEATLRCALAAHLLADHRLAEATLTLHGVEALLPRCPSAHQIELRFRLGELLNAQGQTERAQEHFRSVETLDPHGRYAAAAWRASRL
jgi:tetratricopeptide (TPR) repeat protein